MKTFIGCVEKGFDFLGYHFEPGRLSVAKQTVDNFLTHIIQLYEQNLGDTAIRISRIGRYVSRWLRWAKIRDYLITTLFSYDLLLLLSCLNLLIYNCLVL